jgi:fructokinase
MSRRPILVGLGEVLWDVFSDGPRFGGAPANFASSVAALAPGELEVHMVSAVGRDELGRRAVELLKERGVDTSRVAVSDHPTGQVLVRLDADGRPSYEISEGAAWDNIEWNDDLQQLAIAADVVCFGTLGQRSGTSRRTIQRFVESTPENCLRIFDINLRAPFWTEEVVLQSLELANVVKLNDTELVDLARMLGWSGTQEELLARLIRRFSLQALALTRGEAGAVCVSASGERSNLPSRLTVVADTVGAGDAYTGALAIGLVRGLSMDMINAWAVRVASFVCSQPGATPALPQELRHPF